MTIHVSWWWIICLPIVFSLHMQKVFLFVFVLLSIHEGMHILFAQKRGYHVQKVVISPIGLSAHIKDFEYKKSKDEIVITLAGLSVHIITYFLLPLFVELKFMSTSFMLYLNNINMSIFLFNLIPIYPLDGGRILGNIFELIFPIKTAKKLRIISSIIVLGTLIYVGFYEYIMGIFFILFFLVHIILDCCLFDRNMKQFYLYRYLHGVIAKKKVHHKQDIYKNKDNYLLVRGNIIREKSFLTKYF